MHFSYYTTLILASSIVIPAIIGVVRFKYIAARYRPFLYLIWAGCLNEIVSVYCAFRFHNNIASNVAYSLIESFLLLWLFQRLKLFGGKTWLLYSLALIFFCIWLFESFLANRFGSQFSVYFDVVYSFCVVLLSIRAINQLLTAETEILKNPTFLICIGFVIFFSYEIIERVFWIYGLENSLVFKQSVQAILFLTNFFTNLLFGLAVLWMKKKQGFIRQF